MKKNIFDVAIEQENLIITRDFKLYNGDIKLPVNFTKDFANNQVEYVSPVLCCTTKLEELYNNTYLDLKQNYTLWPLSEIKGINKNDIVIAQLDDPEKMNYRNYLFTRNSSEKLLMSGIHFNCSFKDEFLESELEKLKITTSELYFNIYKNFQYYGPSLMFFTSFSPEVDMISKRNSSLGYNNEKELQLDNTTISNFVASITNSIKEGLIKDRRELHTRARLKCGARKCKAHDDFFCANYFELRAIDLNPLSKNGIKKETLDFLLSFILFLHLTPTKEIDTNTSLNNFDSITLNGRKSFVELNNEEVSNVDFTVKTLEEMITTLTNNDFEQYVPIVKQFKDNFINEKTDLDKLTRLSDDIHTYFKTKIKGGN